MRELVDLLFPGRCVACGRNGDVLCPICIRRLPLLAGPTCARCGSAHGDPCHECQGRDLAFTSARSAVAYRGDVARAVRAWKEGGASRMTLAAARIVGGVVARPSVDSLTSVPPEPDRALWRGLDPAGALARALQTEWGVPYERLLRRRRGSVAQKGLGAAGRRTNLAGAFVATRGAPPRVGLIDDVYTTGATASAAASALREAGAIRVEVVTFARAIRLHRPGAECGRGDNRLR